MPTELPPALQALADTGLKLARQAPSGRVALMRSAALVDLDAVPRDLRPIVERLFADLPEPEPLDAKTIEKALKDAWGRAPGKVLDEFDPAPIAVRAAAQVHRGELDGTPVAIKIRRPGLDRAVRADLSLLETLAVPLRAALPAADVGALLRDMREQTADEIDLEHEATTQRRAARAIRHIEGVVVPRPHTELAASGVLVTDLLDGKTLAEGGAFDGPATAATALVQAHVTASRDAGLVLVDPRPGHVVALRDGRVGLLGAGLARPVSPERVAVALSSLTALRDDDADTLAAAAERSGMVSADAARSVFGGLRAIAGPIVDGPAVLDAAALAGMGVRSDAHAGALLRLVPETAVTPDDAWLARSVSQLLSVLARLEAEIDWADVALSTPAP
ncbi:MAG: hypothetical protein JHC95_00145 [Solirubrobacteraceae bacterium]|nr:hypothetical protein [Solirubrobacteraceae bacterium]